MRSYYIVPLPACSIAFKLVLYAQIAMELGYVPHTDSYLISFKLKEGYEVSLFLNHCSNECLQRDNGPGNTSMSNAQVIWFTDCTTFLLITEPFGIKIVIAL